MGRKSKEINQEERRIVGIVLRLFRKTKSIKEIGELIGRPTTTIKISCRGFKKQKQYKMHLTRSGRLSKLSQKDKSQILRKVLKTFKLNARKEKEKQKKIQG